MSRSIWHSSARWAAGMTLRRSGAARAGLLRDVESMLRFAMLAEETSASKYREFASLATSPGAREALERIASEEDRHLSELRTQG